MSGRSFSLRPAKRLEGLAAYHPPVKNPHVVLPLHGTERPRAEGTHASYPDRTALSALLAKKFNVERDRVYVGAGADEVIDRICRAVLDPGDEILVSRPTFEMIGHFAKLAGANVAEIEWLGGEYPVEEVLAQITPKTRILAVVSPNNPTGLAISRTRLETLLTRLPEVLLLLDSAYVEFADDDLTSIALEYPNAIIVRTFSKAWAIPGARVGYALGQAAVVEWMEAAGGPYPVADRSLEDAATFLVEHAEDTAAYVQTVRTERALLEAHVRTLGGSCEASQANFVFAKIPHPHWVDDALHSLGISTRAFPKIPVVAGMRRITCPADRDGFLRLTNALSASIRPRAVLFDMDGVIVDVSASYRRAISDTAATFGVEVSSEAIATMKERGNANNDWVVTHRLITEAGVIASLDDVTNRFETLYQGTIDSAGLRETETLLAERECFVKLSKHVKLGIVTGRPRRDAEFFLKKHALDGLFETVVAMEDAALKPDPAPVRLALSLLGESHGWMIGDTPDDVRAAAGAGVIPLGYVQAGEHRERSVRALEAAGAARILEKIEDIERLLEEIHA